MPAIRLAKPAAVLLSLCLALIAAGCSSPGSRRADPQATLRKLTASAYAPREHAIRTRRETWNNGDIPVETVLTTPADGGAAMPLVIYLPGLGESAAGGALWREHWAHAGYAVLSFQLAASGPDIWSSPQARGGDFRGVSRAQFAPEAIQAKVQALRFVLEEMQRRHDAGTAPFAGIDLAHPALAGFDLGAQAAAVAFSSTALRGRFGAVLLLAQVMPPARSASDGPWPLPADLAGPALVVTGTDDRDPYEYGSGPHARQSAWAAWPAGDKYFLMLDGSPHALFAGEGVEDPNSPTPYIAPSAGASSQGGGGRRGRRGMSSSDSSTRGGGAGIPPDLLDLRQLAAVQAVTLAFLDASVGGKAPARQWLARDARDWLGRSGELSMR